MDMCPVWKRSITMNRKLPYNYTAESLLIGSYNDINEYGGSRQLFKHLWVKENIYNVFPSCSLLQSLHSWVNPQTFRKDLCVEVWENE